MRVRLLGANLFLLSAFIVLVAVCFGYFEHPVIKLNQHLQAFVQEPSTENLQRWFDTYATSDLFNLNSQKADIPVVLSTYTQQFEQYNQQNWPWLIPIKVHKLEVEQETTKFSTDRIAVAHLAKGVEIILRQGQDQIRPVISLDWDIGGVSNGVNASLRPTQELVVEVRQAGTASEAEVLAALQTEYQALTQALLSTDLQALVHDSDISDVGLLEVRQKPNLPDLLNNTKLQSAQTLMPPQALTNKESLIVVTPIQQTNCPLPHELRWQYDWQAQDYKAYQVAGLVKGLCTQPGIVQLACKDCSLAPVDKVHKLSADYKPDVVNTQVLGGGQLTPLAAQALRNLFAAAAQEKVSVKVLSAYRSYEQQINTFEYWVKLELNKGRPRAQAEIEANKYSALPGFSEHQLGTTVDLACAECMGFEGHPGNFALYNFLERRAHEFGFVVSYPRGTEQFTGYRYEPWHIRFVGPSLAKELHATGYLRRNGMYLAKFLRQKSIY